MPDGPDNPPPSQQAPDNVPPGMSEDLDFSDFSGGFDEGFPGGIPEQASGGRAGAAPSDFTGWIWIALSIIFLVAGLILAKKYKS